MPPDWAVKWARRLAGLLLAYALFWAVIVALLLWRQPRDPLLF